MKNLLFIMGVCGLVLAVAADKSFSSDKSYTQKGIAKTFSQQGVLNASEVSQLLIGKTMNVLSEKTDKDTGKHMKYKAYVSELGAWLVVFESGARETRTWSVKDDGALCTKRTMGRHTNLVNCGYIVPKGNGVYKMYEVKHVYKKNGRVVGGKHVKQLVTFFNFKKGNRL